MFNAPAAENQPKKAIGHLLYDGKLVVDYRQEPVQNYPSLPLVISSKAEGWRIDSFPPETHLAIHPRTNKPIVSESALHIETSDNRARHHVSKLLQQLAIERNSMYLRTWFAPSRTRKRVLRWDSYTARDGRHRVGKKQIWIIVSEPGS